MYESSTKETKWVCIQLACSRRPRAFEEAIVVIYNPSSIMKHSHQYMKVKKQETLYHEDHGATLKHKCGKRIVTLSLLSFSLIFWGAFSFFLWPFSFFGLLSFFYGLSLFFFYIPHLGQCYRKMMIITLLFIYNSMITTRYQNKV